MKLSLDKVLEIPQKVQVNCRSCVYLGALPYLSRCAELQVLNLIDNELSLLGVAGYHALGEALSCCPELHTLNLPNSRLRTKKQIRDLRANFSER